MLDFSKKSVNSPKSRDDGGFIPLPRGGVKPEKAPYIMISRRKIGIKTVKFRKKG